MYEIQIFLPGELNIENLISIFKLLRKYNIYSWLSGLKFHKKEEYIFSFCDYGISISLNFSGKQIQQEKFKKMFKNLNDIVKKLNGRYNLSKDSLLREEEFMTQNYFEKYLKEKKYFDPNNLLSSDLNNRLKIYINE